MNNSHRSNSSITLFARFVTSFPSPASKSIFLTEASQYPSRRWRSMTSNEDLPSTSRRKRPSGNSWHDTISTSVPKFAMPSDPLVIAERSNPTMPKRRPYSDNALCTSSRYRISKMCRSVFWPGRMGSRTKRGSFFCPSVESGACGR